MVVAAPILFVQSKYLKVAQEGLRQLLSDRAIFGPIRNANEARFADLV